MPEKMSRAADQQDYGQVDAEQIRGVVSTLARANYLRETFKAREAHLSQAIKSVGAQSDSQEWTTPEERAEAARVLRRDLDRDVDEFRKIETINDSNEKKAKAFIANVFDAPVGYQVSDPYRDIRQATAAELLNAVYRVDELSGQAIEALGFLWMRTPAFFAVSGCVPVQAEHAQHLLERHPLRQNDELPKHTLHMESVSHVDVLEHIEDLLHRATAGFDESAILELMGLHASDDLTLEEVAHLERSIVEVWHRTKQKDEMTCSEGAKPRKSVLLQLWPQKEEEGLIGRNNSCQLLMRFFKAASDRDDFEDVLNRCDALYAEKMQKEPLLHITPQVVKVLLPRIEHGVVNFLREERILYGHLDQKWLDISHWTMRRASARAVCNLAEAGNVFAVELIWKRLLWDDWTIRDLTIPRACTIARRLAMSTKHQEVFTDVMRALMHKVCKLPPPERAFVSGNLEVGPEEFHAPSKHRHGPPHMISAKERDARLVNRTMASKMSQWAPEVQKRLINAANVFVSQHGSVININKAWAAGRNASGGWTPRELT